MCKHLSHVGIQLKDLLTKSCAQLCKVIIPSIVTAQAVLSQHQKMKNCDESEEERARRLARKMDQNKDREPKCSHYPIKSTVRSMSIRDRSSC